MVTQDPFGLNARPPLSMKLVQPNRQSMVVLERTEDNPEPDYCIHGRTKCYHCDRWCHLGTETYKLVESGGAMPFCMQCATKVMNLPENKDGVRLRANLNDHRREDGPHG